MNFYQNQKSYPLLKSSAAGASVTIHPTEGVEGEWFSRFSDLTAVDSLPADKIVWSQTEWQEKNRPYLELIGVLKPTGFQETLEPILSDEEDPESEEVTELDEEATVPVVDPVITPESPVAPPVEAPKVPSREEILALKASELKEWASKNGFDIEGKAKGKLLEEVLTKLYPGS